MLLAFLHPFGPREKQPELCLIPSKPDQFSHPICVESFCETHAAVYRLSLHEGVRVKKDASKRSIIIEPVPPSKLYLTPSQLDRPGFVVAAAKIIVLGDHDYETFYLSDLKNTEWKKWFPNEYS